MGGFGFINTNLWMIGWPNRVEPTTRRDGYIRYTVYKGGESCLMVIVWCDRWRSMYIYNILYVLSWKTNFVCGVIKICCGMKHSNLCNCCKLQQRIVYFGNLAVYFILGMMDGVWIFVYEIGVSTLHCDIPEHCLSISIFSGGEEIFKVLMWFPWFLYLGVQLGLLMDTINGNFRILKWRYCTI